MQALLVEDQTLVREGLRLLIRQLRPDIDVRQAGSVEEARRQVAESGPFDLVILDLGLPGMRGLEAIDAMRAIDDRLPIVVLSGAEDANVISAALEAGAMGFIQKSVDPAAMDAALDCVLQGRVWLPPACLATGATGGAGDDTGGLAGLHLSLRQEDVLRCLARGLSNKVIARELGIAEPTVKTHLKRVFEVLGVHSRSQAMVQLSRRGWALHQLA